MNDTHLVSKEDVLAICDAEIKDLQLNGEFHEAQAVQYVRLLLSELDYHLVTHPA